MAGRYRHHVREQSHRNKIRKALMKFMPIIELDPLADGWASGYYIAEKLSEHIQKPYSSSFNTLIGSILYEQAERGKVEFRQYKSVGAASNPENHYYRLPNALERLAQL